jgi:hypothetical protein
MRQLVIAINVFFQRHDVFLIIQRSKKHRTSFNLIQNVKTKWDNTFCMMKRALCLKMNISNWLNHQTFDSNIHTKKKQRKDLRKLCMSEQEWKKVAYMINLLRFFHDWTQEINKTRDAIVNFVFSAYNNLFDHLKDQKIKCETIDIFWFDDYTKKLVFYQICHFTNIFHEYFSRIFLTNIFHECFILTFSFIILITSYKANVENLRI